MYLTHLVVKMLRQAGFHDLANAVLRADAAPTPPRRREEPVDDTGYEAASGAGGGAPASAHGHEDSARQAGGEDSDHASASAGPGGGSGADFGGPVHGSGSSSAAHVDASTQGASHPSEAGHDSEHDAHASHSLPQGTTPDIYAPHVHEAHTDLRDPLAGIRSEQLREGIQRDAFRSASADAQDTAIYTAARLPGGFDFSPEAQATRLAALNGERPSWAVDDVSHTPASPSREAPAVAHAEAQPRASAARMRESDFER